MRTSETLFRIRRAAAALLIGMSIAGGIVAGPAHAFDPKQVFKEDKPSFSKIFRHYLNKKKQGDNAEALDVLKYAAEQGNQTAQWKLGKMYEKGDGVAKSDAEAYRFYRQIADRYGDARPNTPEWAITGKAMVALGQFYRSGITDAGIPADANEARVMFTTAAMYFRDPDGQFELGKMMLEDDEVSFEEGRQALRILDLARKKGHPGAMALMGSALVEGEYILPDKVRGLSMLTRAAKRAPAEMQPWISELQAEAFALASEEERREAMLKVKSE